MEGWYRLAIAGFRVGIAAAGLRIRVHGAENLPRSGPVLLASTHCGYPDFVPIAHAGRQRGRWIRFVTRHDVWNKSMVARAMDGMRHIPIDREAPAGAYLSARSRLRDGDAVCLFPEAGISYSYAVRGLMKGAASLARETGAPVLPVAIWGTQRVYSVGRPVEGREPRPDWTRGRPVDVAIGPPMPPPGEDLTAWTVGLGHTLTEMLEGLQRLPEHRPAPGEHAPWYPHHLGGHAPDRREALDLDSLPRSAVPPVWGPPVAHPRPD